MNNINKTLYIPLYGKAAVSEKGIILDDPKAEVIWQSEGFPLRGKSKSKWLSYYMAMRARVFDDWVKKQKEKHPNAVVLHIGCGLDSRAERVGTSGVQWYDIDFPAVISERRKYFAESESYHMYAGDASDTASLEALPSAENGIIIMEGVSMYLTEEQMHGLFAFLQNKFEHTYCLVDCYTTFGVKASRRKNPINDVGAQVFFGVDRAEQLLINSGTRAVAEHSMTPDSLVQQLKGFERRIFRRLFAGSFAEKIYRLFEYEFEQTI